MKLRGVPQVLSIAGFDPSGRAGVLADIWAIGRAGGAPVAVVTALTAQGSRFACVPVSPKGIRDQLAAVLAEGSVRAAKLGMVPNRRALAAVVELLAGTGRWPIVIDPVVQTSRGQRLSSLRPGDYLELGMQLGRRHRLVLTPNRDELAWLGVRPADLLGLGFWGVVVKGSDSAIDEVFTRQRHQLLRGARLPRSTSHHRGTGCRFGSGLATALARGEDLAGAARTAKRLVRRFLSTPIIR